MTIPWWQNTAPHLLPMNYPYAVHGNNCNVGFLAGNVEVTNIYDLHENRYKENPDDRIKWHWKDLEK